MIRYAAHWANVDSHISEECFETFFAISDCEQLSIAPYLNE